jgi:hypothetical protein
VTSAGSLIFPCAEEPTLPCSLEFQHDPALVPELLQAIMVALVGAEKMHDYISVVDDHPSFPGFSLFATVLTMFLVNRLHRRLCKCIQHAVTRARAQDEIIGERGNFLDIQEQDILALPGFERLDDRMSKFKCVQTSPLALQCWRLARLTREWRRHQEGPLDSTLTAWLPFPGTL